MFLFCSTDGRLSRAQTRSNRTRLQRVPEFHYDHHTSLARGKPVPRHEAHNHTHAHSGGHQHGVPSDYGRAFAIGIALNLAYVIAEGGFGIATGSLALLADAGHNLGDVLGLVLSWGAGLLSGRSPGGPSTHRYRPAPLMPPTPTPLPPPLLPSRP